MKKKKDFRRKGKSKKLSQIGFWTIILTIGALKGFSSMLGEVAEWLNALAWKACKG